MKTFNTAHAMVVSGFVLAALAASVQAAGDGRAVAATQDARSVSVRYSAAETGSAEGVQALYARLEAAARNACRRDSDRGVGALAERRNCRAAALDAAVADVHDARLSRLHQERTAARADAQVASLDAAVGGE